MLINSFFTPIQLPVKPGEINKEKAVEFSVSIKLNPDHSIFKGHFPEKPIVPGVTYIEMIREIMEVVYKKKFFLKESSTIKFLTVTNPLQNTELIFNISVLRKDDNLIATKVLISSESGIVIKFAGNFLDN